MERFYPFVAAVAGKAQWNPKAASWSRASTWDALLGRGLNRAMVQWYIMSTYGRTILKDRTQVRHNMQNTRKQYTDLKTLAPVQNINTLSTCQTWVPRPHPKKYTGNTCSKKLRTMQNPSQQCLKCIHILAPSIKWQTCVTEASPNTPRVLHKTSAT